MTAVLVPQCGLWNFGDIEVCHLPFARPKKDSIPEGRFECVSLHADASGSGLDGAPVDVRACDCPLTDCTDNRWNCAGLLAEQGDH
jgi:hypothetical protein